MKNLQMSDSDIKIISEILQKYLKNSIAITFDSKRGSHLLNLKKLEKGVKYQIEKKGDVDCV